MSALVLSYPKLLGVEDLFDAIARRLGADPAMLANLINFESGWNPGAENPASGASGLIQFTPSTARKLGTTVESIRKMSVEAQLPLVERYLAPYRGKLNSKQGLYMSVFYPKAAAWPPGQEFPPAVQRANPGIRTPADYIRLVDRKARIRVAEKVAIGSVSVWLLGGAVLLTTLIWRSRRNS